MQILQKLLVYLSPYHATDSNTLILLTLAYSSAQTLINRPFCLVIRLTNVIFNVITQSVEANGLFGPLIQLN